MTEGDCKSTQKTRSNNNNEYISQEVAKEAYRPDMSKMIPNNAFYSHWITLKMAI